MTITVNASTARRHDNNCNRYVVDLIEYMIDRIEEGESIVGFFLDLSKAFDCLDRTMVLAKLEYLGFRETALSWFASYLSDRDQLVEFN